MPDRVSRDTIDQRVVNEWARLVQETAQDRGDNLRSVQPFHGYLQTYDDVLAEIKQNTHQGLAFYRMMVVSSVGYEFSPEKAA